jgi:hypothetical protein
MENTVSPAAFLPQPYAISGLIFSILNSVSPAAAGPQTYAISGLTFSILNSVSPAAAKPQTYAISGLTFSILNSVSPAVAKPQTYSISGLTFSILNGPAPALRRAPGPPSLSFRIPINPLFLAEALARGAERENGKPVCMDTDGDGYPDGLELRLGSDPLDPKSIPDIRGPGYYATPPLSIHYTIPTARPTPSRQGAIDANNKQ